MEGIIVGVDESDHARAALRWAVDHGAHTHEPVTAVMAWGYIDQHHLEPGTAFDPHYTGTDAARVLDALVARAVDDDDEQVRRLAVCDLPARTLLDTSKDAALLVVGARGLGGFRGLAIGSISRQVLHDAVCPVTVVRDDADRAGRPVVVGVDGSGPSQRALAWALDLARTRRVPLVAVHAWRLPYATQTWYAAYPDPAELAATAERFLDDQLARVDTTGLVAPVERRVVDDRPSSALLEAAATASVVVVGSRGHGQIASALLGSVSDQVVHHATCPVVVVP
jgi:nucleotide-binding universal stress UspA family protein